MESAKSIIGGLEEKIMNETLKENKMGTMPVPRLLFTMSLPLILSMLVQALYNIVDSIFVAQINENALTAVSLAFPIQNLMISVASGTGVGVNALLSRSLGEKDMDRVNKAANNSILLTICSYLAFAVLGIAGSKAFFSTQTTDPQILEYGVQYMTIVCVFSFGLFMQIMLERLLQSTGLTIFNMISQGTGAIVNIILDPIFIFGLCGMPKLGVIGAAVATVIGQICGMLIGLYFNLKKNKEIQFSIKRMRFDGRTVKEIYIVGVPSILMMSIGSVMTYGMNKILLGFSSTAAAVFGVYFKLQSFFFMPVFGLNNGLVPIIAYNYGARNKERIMKTIKLGCGAAVCILVFGALIFQTMPATLLRMFNASEDMIGIGVTALRVISLSFFLAGFCIVIGSVFQALGNGMYSLIVSVSRQLLVLLPTAYLFSKLFGLHAVWWSFPVAELASLSASVLLLIRIYRSHLKNL